MVRKYVRGVALVAVFGLASCDSPPAEEDAGGADAAAVDAFVAECTTDEMCDDGLFCTGVEACEAGRCVARDPIDCDDGLACTEDSCDEAGGLCVNAPPDADGDGQTDAACLALDGAPLGTDCDDADPNRFAGNIERCDADHRDEDCNSSTFGRVDADGDGFPSARCCNEQEDGSLGCGSDCDDTRSAVQPDSPEVCNRLDDDCDGDVDEGVSIEGFVDADHDGFGGPIPRTACAGAVGFATVGGDCADDNAARRPGQIELCDGFDNDCDPETDEMSGPITWYRDLDGDLFGSAASGTVEDCADRRPEFSILDTDCNDDPDNGGAGANPAQAELCNGIDDDCNGAADFQIGVNDFEDDDGDGSVDLACGAPLGEDCDDADPVTSAGSVEVCDGRDNDCDDNVDEGATGTLWYRDVDGDGWGSERSGAMVSCDAIAGHVSRSGDCNDDSVDISPDAAEVCDGFDNDCNGAADDGAAFTSCSLSNASSTCAGGRCRVEACLDGFDSCDDDEATGCETATNSPSACGCMPVDCGAAPNVATPSCQRPAPGLGFQCVIATNACAPDFADCDGFASNGCETPTDRSSQHCGGCNNVCPNQPGATPVCIDSGCEAQCLPGRLDCGGSGDGCESSSSDVTTCGDCDNDCTSPLPPNTSGGADIECASGPSGNFCRIGSTECAADFSDCNGIFADGCEVDTRNHPIHCGGCNMPCIGEDEECINGTCTPECGDSRLDCDVNVPGCEVDVFNDPMRRCGTCSNSCVSNQNCDTVTGTCVCPPFSLDCDLDLMNGCEADILRDRFNCNGCGNLCGNGLDCVNGSCECPPGMTDCDGDPSNGCEADLLRDADRCGACMNSACDGGQFCDNGLCTDCGDDLDNCDRFDGCETALGDRFNCGGCGDECGFDATCVVDTCECNNPDRGDCDGDPFNGCEADLDRGDSCGSCTLDCSDHTFCEGAGSCAPCTGPDLDCDQDAANGCEAYEYDRDTCGGCDTRCFDNQFCSMTTGCTDCGAGMGDCDFDGLNGCETDVTEDNGNCGGCGQFCNGTCSDGLCCPFGMGVCDGDAMCDDDLLSDAANCGSCGNSCGPGGQCNNGVCDGVVDVAVGGSFTCALHGGGGVTCWGANAQGQLGSGTVGGTGFGSPILPDDAVELSLGGDHGCALLANGEVWCWGLNSEGRVGNGTVGGNIATPVHVTGFGPALTIAAGSDHTCAIERSSQNGQAGPVWCWGRDNEGQLGTAGTAASSASPVQSTDTGGFDGFEHLVAGGDFTCGSLFGQLSCWGRDNEGQAGNGANGANDSPTDQIFVGNGIRSMSAGFAHVCALDHGNTVYCWGRNSAGQVLIGGASNYTSPQFHRSNVFEIGGGYDHQLWREGGDEVLGIGANNNAQLGSGDALVPTEPVGPAQRFLVVARGLAVHSCAIDYQQRVWCWGNNAVDQAVPGQVSPVLTPTLVQFP